MTYVISINSNNYESFNYILPYIRYCAEDNYTTKWELEGRRINDYELIFITGGTGSFTVSDNTYNVKENDLILLKPGKYHSASSLKHPFSFLCSHFDLFASKPSNTAVSAPVHLYESIPSKPIKYYKAALDLPEYIKIGESTSVRLLFKRIVKEWSRRQPGSNIMLKALFSELLCQVFRQIDSDCHTSTYNRDIDAISLFIKDNYMKRIYLSDIAATVHLQPSYISSLFKKHTGTTVTEYINKYRIAMSKELLVTSDFKLDDIACKTGFYDIHHYSRVFKEYEGLTPSQYRMIKDI